MGKQFPELYSIWVHYDRSAYAGLAEDEIVAAIFAGQPIPCTFICVTGTSWSGNDDSPGRVAVDYFSQHSPRLYQANKVVRIPDEIRDLTIDGFWRLVAERKLRLLTEQIDTVATQEPIFQPGDTIAMQP